MTSILIKALEFSVDADVYDVDDEKSAVQPVCQSLRCFWTALPPYLVGAFPVRVWHLDHFAKNCETFKFATRLNFAEGEYVSHMPANGVQDLLVKVEFPRYLTFVNVCCFNDSQFTDDVLMKLPHLVDLEWRECKPGGANLAKLLSHPSEALRSNLARRMREDTEFEKIVDDDCDELLVIIRGQPRYPRTNGLLFQLDKPVAFNSTLVELLNCLRTLLMHADVKRLDVYEICVRVAPHLDPEAPWILVQTAASLLHTLCVTNVSEIEYTYRRRLLRGAVQSRIFHDSLPLLSHLADVTAPSIAQHAADAVRFEAIYNAAKQRQKQHREEKRKKLPKTLAAQRRRNELSSSDDDSDTERFVADVGRETLSFTSNAVELNDASEPMKRKWKRFLTPQDAALCEQLVAVDRDAITICNMLSTYAWTMQFLNFDSDTIERFVAAGFADALIKLEQNAGLLTYLTHRKPLSYIARSFRPAIGLLLSKIMAVCPIKMLELGVPQRCARQARQWHAAYVATKTLRAHCRGENEHAIVTGVNLPHWKDVAPALVVCAALLRVNLTAPLIMTPPRQPGEDEDSSDDEGSDVDDNDVECVRSFDARYSNMDDFDHPELKMNMTAEQEQRVQTMVLNLIGDWNDEDVIRQRDSNKSSKKNNKKDDEDDDAAADDNNNDSCQPEHPLYLAPAITSFLESLGAQDIEAHERGVKMPNEEYRHERHDTAGLLVGGCASEIIIALSLAATLEKRATESNVRQARRRQRERDETTSTTAASVRVMGKFLAEIQNTTALADLNERMDSRIYWPFPFHPCRVTRHLFEQLVCHDDYDALLEEGSRRVRERERCHKKYFEGNGEDDDDEE